MRCGSLYSFQSGHFVDSEISDYLPSADFTDLSFGGMYLLSLQVAGSVLYNFFFNVENSVAQCGVHLHCRVGFHCFR